MFEDTINGLGQTRTEFDSKVKDSFGRSIDEKVFDHVEAELEKLESEYSAAEMKMNEIKMITMELITIV